MTIALFYDTETTGLPLFKEPSEHPDQPHIVQLAACLVDLVTRDIISSMDVIVRPDGWTIPDDVAAIHVINTARATAEGVPEAEAVSMFMGMWGAGRKPCRSQRAVRCPNSANCYDAPSGSAWRGNCRRLEAREGRMHRKTGDANLQNSADGKDAEGRI